jgi:uncharacterized protein YndB with AHSA1/START domain
MLLILLAAAVAAFLLYVASRPGSFRIERRTSIAAPAERIFPMLSDFRRWTDWSPWEKLDPNLQRTFSGAPMGTGAVYEWRGNNKAGAGRMEIVESHPSSLVRIKLDFIKPFRASNTVDLTLTPAGGGTEMRWVMTGASPFISKLFGVFMNMDQMIGKDFEAGLANIKRLAEQ